MDKQLTECVNATFIGLRVIRGHKWTLDHRGSALMGTIIGYRSGQNQYKKYIDVRWDDGKNTILEHPGTNTLCVLNNDTSAVWHRESCTICQGKIKGFLWKCVECDSTNLCHNCYHGKKHDLCHNFKRFDWPGHDGTSVGKRERARTIRTEGICEKAVVEPAIDCCGRVKHLRGEVKAVVSGGSTDYRWAAVVEWSLKKSSTHQLGLEGRVELICKKPVPGMKLYIDHLPAPWELDGMATYELVNLQPPGLKKYKPYGQVQDKNPYVMSPEDRVVETNSERQPPQPNHDDPTVSDNEEQPYEDVEVKPIVTYQYTINREDTYPEEDEVEVDPEKQNKKQEFYIKPDPITNSIGIVQKTYTPKHVDEELEIREGDTILSVRHLSGGWMAGYLDGKHGIFPEDCVEVVCVGAQEVSEMLHTERKILSTSDRERRISSTLERLDVFTNEFTSEDQQNEKPQPMSKQTVKQIPTSDGSILEESLDRSSESKSCLPVNPHQPKVKKCVPVTTNVQDNETTSGIQDILNAKMRLKPIPKPKPSPAKQQTTVTKVSQSTSKPPASPVKISKPVPPTAVYQNWPQDKSGDEPMNLVPGTKCKVNSARQEKPIPGPKKHKNTN